MRSILILVLLFFGFQCVGLPWSALFKPSRLKIKKTKVAPKTNLEKELIIEPDSKPKVTEELVEKSESKQKSETVKELLAEPIKQFPQSTIETVIDTFDKDLRKDEKK